VNGELVCGDPELDSVEAIGVSIALPGLRERLEVFQLGLGTALKVAGILQVP